MKKVPSVFTPVISVDRKAAKPLHKQIYDAFRAMIVLGNLRAGQQIPSTRALAPELGISRIPVLGAYAQLLAEGYFESRTGAGTFVCSSMPDQLAPNERRVRSAKAHSVSRPIAKRVSLLPRYERLPWVGAAGAFRVSQPEFDQFPFRVWSSLVMRPVRNPPAKA